MMNRSNRPNAYAPPVNAAEEALRRRLAGLRPTRGPDALQPEALRQAARRARLDAQRAIAAHELGAARRQGV